MVILNKMTNPEAEQRRLCQLIHQNLSAYLDNNTSLLTKQTQKNLLISLSQVFTRIKQWIKEYECNSDSGQDDPAIPIDYDDCSALSTLHSDDHHCLTRIISHLMSVLAFENPFVQHLTGNVLVAIYELLVAYEGDWEVFINRVSLFMTYAIGKNLSAHMEPIIAEPKNSDIRLPVQIIPLKLKKSSCWSIPVALTRVLRNIMKILKQDFNSEIYDVYICLSMEMIASIPWHLLNDVSVVQTEESVGCLTRDVPLHSSNPQQKSKSVFKGNLLQFFCSLDENHDDVESGAVSERNQLLVSAVSNLIPDLLSWCLGEQGSSYNVDLFHYFRHKLLILMIRSMSQIHLDFDSLSSWLHLIWKYFTCSLMQKIYCPLSDLNDCLKDSPFGLSALHEKQDQVSPNHVQRLAIFLLFRCSFNLISLEGTTSCPCACAVPNTSFITDFNVASNCLSRRRGLIELHRWLQGQLHDNIFEDSLMYSTRCISFATSFLRLYIHEDDILFKMLLLLLEVPVYVDRIGEEEAHSTAKTIIFLVTDIFNPIDIFHLFLAEIHYDHQVLLDYLISKDSGPCSAEYLLRSLRVICTSWYRFKEFPRNEGTTLNSKKRKLLVDCVDFEGLSSTLPVNHGGLSPLYGAKCKKEYSCETSRRLSLQDAKACLLSLKESVENLRERDLFPYNPQVLLKRDELADVARNAFMMSEISFLVT